MSGLTRKYYWYLSAFLRKHGTLLLISVVGASVFFSLFIPNVANRLETKPRRYIGMVGSYTLQTLPQTIQEKISAGLTTVEDDGSVSPAVAARWSVEDDGKTYRFVIKDNLVWQDGKPLQPSDIGYSFKDVETITTQNDVVFKLPDSYIPFPTIVSQPLFRSTSEPYLFLFRREKIIGLGTHQVLSFTKESQRLQQSERLTELVLDSDQERLIYRFYPTEDTAVAAFKRGEVDTLTDLTAPHDVADWPTTTITQRLHPERYLAVFFNLNDPKFAKNIRQALSYALEKPSGALRAIGPISPLSWAYLEGGKTYDYDLERATERILSALPEQTLTFELLTTPSFEAKAEQIKQQWESFGDQAVTACQADDSIKDKSGCDHLDIQVQIRITNFPDTTNFESLLIGQESPADPDQYYFWHSEQSTNFTHYKNTRIDSLLEKGRQVGELQERKAVYQEFQQFLLEDAPAVFLEHLSSFDISRK